MKWIPQKEYVFQSQLTTAEIIHRIGLNIQEKKFFSYAKGFFTGEISDTGVFTLIRARRYNNMGVKIEGEVYKDEAGITTVYIFMKNSNAEFYLLWMPIAILVFFVFDLLRMISNQMLHPKTFLLLLVIPILLLLEWSTFNEHHREIVNAFNKIVEPLESPGE